MPYVLIIDDDEDFARAMATVIRTTGNEVGIELEAQNAVSRIEEKLPDLIILDVMFPESSSAGFDLARQIRNRNEKLKTVPIIMLTAVNERFPLGFSSRDIGSDWLPVDDFLEKPVDFDVLKKKVVATLEKTGSGSSGPGKTD